MKKWTQNAGKNNNGDLNTVIKQNIYDKWKLFELDGRYCFAF